MHEIHKGDEPV